MRITGHTRIMFILADPVAHIIGSDVLNHYFAEHGLDVAVSPLHITPADLPEALAFLRRTRNVAGFGVTIPHKIAIVPHLDALTPAARDIGAVNFVRREPDGRLVGDNVDGAGFVEGLARHGFVPEGRRALVVGSGGVGRAIAFALARAGAAQVTIANRTPSAAAHLAGAVNAATGVDTRSCSGADMPALDGFDLVVNATALGMKPEDGLPFDPAGLSPAITVAEVVMTPAETPILAAARARGCPVVPGLAMLAGQPALVARFLGL